MDYLLPNEFSTVLSEYFQIYLKEIRKLSDRSINHYCQALKKSSQFLKDKGLVNNSIYEISDMTQLLNIKTILLSDPEFVALDARGNRMYSAGLNNYIRFAEGHDFSVGVDQINAMDIPVQPEKAIIIEQTTWRRSGILRNQALAYANYRCEIDNSHETFIAENTRMPYMEGHHALPMKMQNDFNVSLDVYANIVCLCPVCHRRIHHGLKFERIDMAKRIFDARGERLENSGIVLSSNEFIERAVNA